MDELHGILVLNKPKGITSHDCVARIRQLIKRRKVGHSGTLDPLVTGVLPICIGQATKVAEYLLNDDKEYVADIALGRSTTTGDIAGQLVQDTPITTPISKARIEEVLRLFQGEIEQTPPMYSAVKVDGQKLYQLARKGIEIDRPARKVHIYELELLDYSAKPPYPSFRIRVRCSKGTYIRTLCVDIGNQLGYPAHLAQMVRKASGSFQLEDSHSFDELESWTREEWLSHLKPIDAALLHLPKLVLSNELSRRVQFGQSIVLDREIKQNQEYRIYNQDHQFLAVYSGLHSRVIKPKKVFLR